MAASLRRLAEIADLIDIVVEVRDARVPVATAVADEHAKLARKPRITLLNRDDLADPAATRAWLARLRKSSGAYAGVGTRAASLRAVRDELLARPRKGAKLRVAVVGAPNTGKSSVINALARRQRARVENRAGITRTLQWLSLGADAEMLDTPGVLAPRIVDADAAWQLALCGSLPDAAFEAEDVVRQFVRWREAHRPRMRVPTLDDYARSRGMLRKGGEPDCAAAARAFIAAFRAGDFGRITFQLPSESN